MSEILFASQFLASVGRATSCACVGDHRPAPLRYVWHHILPEVCGGKSSKDNLVSVCDNCHYGIHAMLYDLKLHGPPLRTYGRFAGTKRAQIALEGYAAAAQAGVVDKIPSEGSISA